ncbi:hypothetical protein BGW38_008958, partial [Lunasporangiospora selenospora]
MSGSSIASPAMNSSIQAQGGAGGSTSTGASQHSLRQLVQAQILEYSRLTQSLFMALEAQAEGKSPQPAPPEIMRSIVQLDSTLMGAVEKIEIHQKQQQRIKQVRDEIENRNKAIMTVVQSLRSAKLSLESRLEHLDERQSSLAGDTNPNNELSVEDIVSYANRLGAYTSAPPNFNPQDPNQPFEPPYPREVNMRAGILNQQHVPAAAL